MTFDVCSDCGGENWLGGAALLALLWALPVMLFAVRRQQRERTWVRKPLAFAQWILALGAVPFSALQFRLIEPTAELYRLTLQVFVVSVFLAVAGVVAFIIARSRTARSTI